MTVIGIVACCKGKLDRTAPARDLYTSPLFKMSLKVAERCCDVVYVASALHHLVELDAVIKPYEHTMRDVGGKKAREHWGRHVGESLVHRHGGEATTDFEFYAGSEYVKPIVRHLTTYRGYVCVDKRADVYKWQGVLGRIHVPLDGMMIGERLAYLRKTIERWEGKTDAT